MLIFNSIQKTKIRFVELGFRFLDKINRYKRSTAYTKNTFINQLKIPSGISIGVMINAGDLLKEAHLHLSNVKKFSLIEGQKLNLLELLVIMKFIKLTK